MSSDGYDSDGDVARYLQSVGDDSHLLDLAPAHGGQIHVPDAETMEMLHPAPMLGIHAPPAFEFQGPAAVDVEQNQAPPALGFQENNPMAAFGFQEQMVGVEHLQAAVHGNNQQALMLGVVGSNLQFQPSGLLDQMVGVQDQPAPAFQHQLPILDFQQHPPPAFGFQETDFGVKLRRAKEQISREPNFSSSVALQRLCCKGGSYHEYVRRISTINEQIMNLGSAQILGSAGQIAAMQLLEAYVREKEDLFNKINMGLRDMEKDQNNNAGPSRS